MEALEAVWLRKRTCKGDEELGINYIKSTWRLEGRCENIHKYKFTNILSAPFVQFRTIQQTMQRIDLSR